MRTVYIPKPKAAFKIGLIVSINGQKMRIDSYAHTGKHFTAHTLPDSARFERVLYVLTDA